MQKFELKVKHWGSVIFHEIYTFSDEDKKSFLEDVGSIRRGLQDNIRYELEGLIIINLGVRYFTKHYPNEDNLRIGDRSIEYLIKKHPDLIIAASIQVSGYKLVTSLPDRPNIKCSDTKIIIPLNGVCGYRCKIQKLDRESNS